MPLHSKILPGFAGIYLLSHCAPLYIGNLHHRGVSR
jgi:hypothetical protein